jgi:uroporphyrinogen III methyltransferase/synthase
MKGRVYLVGAGPGDPGLITVRGLDCLKKADVILYDRLVDESLLDFAQGDAEKIYVGKGVQYRIGEQSRINELIIEKANEGKSVVRLKGGDPFVFGRGGEEAEVLVKEQVPFEIVPGVSSIIAAPAYAGIPLTHRRFASSFTVVTGQESSEKKQSSIRWDKLALVGDTVIFVMALGNLEKIVEELKAYGRDPSTPVAIIKDGTRSSQLTVTGTLSTIMSKVGERIITPPVLLVVGNVVKMREQLRWYDNQPLFGKRILVTRAEHQASQLAKSLRERGAEPLVLPVIEIEELTDFGELDRALQSLSGYDWIVFTSTNGVVSFFNRLHSLCMDSRVLDGCLIGAIGPMTAAALQEHGILADYIPEDYTSDGLLSGFKKRVIVGQRFLLVRSDIAPEKLAESLGRLGAEVQDVAAYRTVLPEKNSARGKQMLVNERIDIITFTSSSTVTNLLALIDSDRQVVENVTVACIGPEAAATAQSAGLKVDIIAAEHTVQGLVEAMEHYFGTQAKETK